MRRAEGLRVIRDQLAQAAGAAKCHGCGCFHATVEALAATETGRDELLPNLVDARATFQPQEYDCLGCPVCYPAIAANAFAEAFPSAAETMDVCPTDAPAARPGWPPLPGDYRVLRYRAAVAVCVLNSDTLLAELLRQGPDEGLSIVGTLRTENLGIERVIRNIVANPVVRFLVLSGEDTRQTIGHLPGQSLLSLFQNGVDEQGRIRGAKGKRPVLKNVARSEIDAFLRQIELVPLIGQRDPRPIMSEVQRCSALGREPYHERSEAPQVPVMKAPAPARLILDPAGYFVVFPDLERGLLLLEHYTNAGLLDAVIEGPSPSALSTMAIERGLLTRLDHAAYLGRELARAERSLQTGERYVQDRAPGEVQEPSASGCRCVGSCGGGTT